MKFLKNKKNIILIIILLVILIIVFGLVKSYIINKGLYGNWIGSQGTKILLNSDKTCEIMPREVNGVEISSDLIDKDLNFTDTFDYSITTDECVWKRKGKEIKFEFIIKTSFMGNNSTINQNLTGTFKDGFKAFSMSGQDYQKNS